MGGAPLGILRYGTLECTLQIPSSVFHLGLALVAAGLLSRGVRASARRAVRARSTPRGARSTPPGEQGVAVEELDRERDEQHVGERREQREGAVEACRERDPPGELPHQQSEARHPRPPRTVLPAPR